MGATVTSMPGSFGRTIATVKFEVAQDKSESCTYVRRGATASCCRRSCDMEEGERFREVEVNLYPAVDLRIRLF